MLLDGCHGGVQGTNAVEENEGLGAGDVFDRALVESPGVADVGCVEEGSGKTWVRDGADWWVGEEETAVLRCVSE